MFKLSSDNKVSLIATFIAFLALFLALLDHCEHRNHTKKTVKPILLMETKGIQDQYGIVLSNQGYGPAIIDSCIIYYDDIKMGNSEHVWKGIFNRHFKSPIDFNIIYSKCSSGLVIRMGEEKLIWGAEMSELEGNKQILDGSIEIISITIYYHSIYDEESSSNFN